MVVGDLAVGGGEVEDVAGGVADGQVGVYQAGGEAEGGGLLVGGGLGWSGGGGRWGVGLGGFLGVEGGGGEERGEEDWGDTHGGIRVAGGKSFVTPPVTMKPSRMGHPDLWWIGGKWGCGEFGTTKRGGDASERYRRLL